MHKIFTLLFVCFIMFFCTSCTTIESIIEEYTQPKEETKTTINYSELKWVWGGYHGENATEVQGCEIANLNVTNNGMSYSWFQGGCEQLGASDRTDASKTLACLFCYIDGEWRGGKFDWISTHRVTRDFHNISTSYHGWDKDAIAKASAYRFVIVGTNGKRTNVIEMRK